MPNENDLEVPESTVTNPAGNAPSLDADKPSQNDLDMIDSALDAADIGSDTGLDISQDNSGQFSRNTGQEPVQQQQPARNPDGTFSGTNTGTQQAPDLDPEIAAIPMPPNMSEKQQSNWRKLAESASVAKRQAAEAEILRQRLAEVEQQRQLPDDYEELKRFRSTFDLKNDPSFKQKYDEPIKNFSNGIYNLLRKHRASDDVIKSIEDAGGPSKVAKSWWKKNIIDKLANTDDGFVDARRLEQSLVNLEDWESAKEQDLQMATQNQSEWVRQREFEAQQREEQEYGQINDYVENITMNVPWARFQEIPPNATPDQIARIQRHNAGVSDLADKFNSALAPQTAQERAAVAAAATLSHVVTSQLRIEQANMAKLQQQLQALQRENSSLKSSGRMPKTTVQGQMSSRSSMSDRIKMSASDAIDLGLDEAGI
jgi:hypothetical protein